MAIVRRLERVTLERDTQHTEVEGTYSVVTDDTGRRYLQVDTYGSGTRKLRGKKSQSIRFSPEAIAQLREILSQEL